MFSNKRMLSDNKATCRYSTFLHVGLPVTIIIIIIIIIIIMRPLRAQCRIGYKQVLHSGLFLANCISAEILQPNSPKSTF